MDSDVNYHDKHQLVLVNKYVVAFNAFPVFSR